MSAILSPYTLKPAKSEADFVTVPVSRSDMQALADIEQIAGKYGLSFFCTRCHGLGLPDGVQVNITGPEKVIACGCTARKYVGHIQMRG